MKIIKPQTSQGPADWFTGDVHPTTILTGEEPSHVRMASVHFAPGARSSWHTHPLGQYLHVEEGTAFVQERGSEVKTLKPGDTIYTGPNVEHWHGASPDSFMTHLAIWEVPKASDPGIEWHEHVTDEEYGQQSSQ